MDQEQKTWPRKLEVCVVLLDDGYASTSLMPIEVFHSAGALWRELQGRKPQNRASASPPQPSTRAAAAPMAA